ncbi:MAG: hypothetical protein IK105_09270 [Thermoguttaceae bacterium]|nr:hypothetical protein [Thermoguttaceae bacterium]
MAILAILNTAMTFGILVGVWWGNFKPKTDLKDMWNEIRKFIGKIVKDK